MTVPFRLLTDDDLDNLPEPAWLIDGLVPDSGLSVLYGPSGTFKSFVALDWAYCVAAGIPWLGRATIPRYVVFVAGEGASGLRWRRDAWREQHAHGPVERMRFLPDATNLRDPEQVTRTRLALDGLPERPGLLVIDTMARAMVGGDEDRAKDVGEFIAAVGGLSRGGAVLVVHHTGKDGGSERGSSALRGAADLMVKAQKKGTGLLRVELTCDKLKDSAAWSAMTLRLEPTILSLAIVGHADDELAVAKAARDDTQERVVAFVLEHQPASKRSIRMGVEGRNQGIDDALDALGKAGRLIHTPAGWEACPDPRGTLGHGTPREGGDSNSDHRAPEGGKTPKGSPEGGTGSTVVEENETCPCPDGHGHPVGPSSSVNGSSFVPFAFRYALLEKARLLLAAAIAEENSNGIVGQTTIDEMIATAPEPPPRLLDDLSEAELLAAFPGSYFDEEGDER